MIIAFYLFWFFVLAASIFYAFRRLLKKLKISTDALQKIASTNYDMNKLVCIAINALIELDKD